MNDLLFFKYGYDFFDTYEKNERVIVLQSIEHYERNEHMSIWNAELFETLSTFVASEHSKQVYKGADGRAAPYYLHLTQVCSRAMRAALERSDLDINKIMACALLHDVIEDCTDTKAEYDRISQFILRVCGENILSGVLALSKQDIFDVNGAKDKSAMMKDSLKRIQAQPAEVWVVKLADRICNLQEPPPHWNSNKRQRYLEEAQFIYQELHSASPLLAQELKNRIHQYQQYIDV